MNMEEMRRERSRAESEIKTVIKEFINRTHLEVHEIELMLSSTSINGTVELLNVSIDVRLPR